MRRDLVTTLVVAFTMILTACGGDGAQTATTVDTQEGTQTVDPVAITLLTHDSFAVSPGVLESFTAETGITVEVIQGGDAGTVVNQAILTQGNPTADVLFGIDTTFLSRGLNADLFIPYETPLLADVDPDLIVDEQHRVTPISYGDVCVNYDRSAYDEVDPPPGEVPPPATLLDLVDERYADQFVVEDPALSSPGLAFLIATITEFPDDADYTWRDYWRDLIDNGVRIESDWETAYYGSFSGGAGEGDRPIVVSYASSPPAEVFFADPVPTEAPTAVVTDGCFRQIEFAGILAGTEHEKEAGQFIDYMLGTTFQEDIPLNMFVFPANTKAQLPPVFVDFAVLPDDPVIGDAASIETNRNEWIESWTDLVRNP